ncbi:MAG: FecR/PupR family sigma factor regulator [Saprospiraceae bacterium]|jgi:ferric-dicitrate binding protein FerR (iron transport regulator)
MAIEPGEELLWNYAKSQCSEAEKAYIEAWLAADPENFKKYQRIQLYTNTMSQNETKPTNTEQQQEEEKSSYQNYLMAIIILLIVFVLLGIYAILNSK